MIFLNLFKIPKNRLTMVSHMSRLGGVSDPVVKFVGGGFATNGLPSLVIFIY